MKKPFAKRILAAASAAALTVSIIPAVHGANAPTVSGQLAASRCTADSAVMENLTPEMVRSVPAEAPLTRQGLCTLVMDSYCDVTGQEPEQTEPVFTDTDNADVLNAYHLGLVNGQRSGIFAPEDTMSRQDFFTSAVQLLDTLGYTYTDDISVDLSGYSDADELMAYAVQPAQVLVGIGAITDTNALQPTQQITAEEAVVIMDRVTSFFEDWQENPTAPQRYLGEEVAEFALNYVGCRYVSGGQGPKKFDCSGLVYYVYKNFGYTLKPGARNQWSKLDERVSKSDLLPGDLVFFSRNGKASGIFHVGIYIGDGQFVHAANSRKGVIVTDLDDAWYANRYHGAKRVIG